MGYVPDTDMLKAFNAEIVEEFRANGGKVGGQFEGSELLLLTTTGAKSGLSRLAPLSCTRIDGKLLVIGGYGGADVNPSWVYNLRANSAAHVEIGTESFDVVARELYAAERDDLVPKIAAMMPRFAEAQAKLKRVIPIFELVASVASS
jgi:deazaflavin-dependent oxidoreductase (nitroreductase family)